MKNYLIILDAGAGEWEHQTVFAEDHRHADSLANEVCDITLSITGIRWKVYSIVEVS